MKTFILAWEEYLNTGNSTILDQLPEGASFMVLCSGESRLDAVSANELRKRWRKLFPRSEIISLTEKVC